MNRRNILIAAAAFAVLTPTSAFAKSPEIFAGENGVALGGYDAVSYFTGAAPQMGSDKFKVNWKGTDWHFATAENLAAFTAAPETYAPQYGGYCAYAAAKGAAAPTDPLAWLVRDKKLYLNNSPAVQELWKKDIPGYIAKADANWPGILK